MDCEWASLKQRSYLCSESSFSPPYPVTHHQKEQLLSSAMAATRVIVSASNTITTSLLQKGPLRNPKTFSLCFKNTSSNYGLLVQKRRLFTCNAIYNPQVQIKEEGQPETLDYRVFLLDNSGKKVLSLKDECLFNVGFCWFSA